MVKEWIPIKEAPVHKQTENKIKELLPLKHVLMTGFSRNALYLLMKAFNWSKPDEMIIPAFTCPVIRFTVEAANVVPIPVDAERDGLNIDPALIEKAITPRTKAIYVVHNYGVPAQIERICEIARKHKLIVIEDLAHSLFTKHNGRQLGTFGDFAILSFTKQIINYQGGGIATNNGKIYRRMLRLQEQEQQAGRFRLGGLIDNYVRFVGSWWESRFSMPALLLMKLNDAINNLVYKGAYGMRIDPSKFVDSERSSRLTARQLDKLYRLKNTPGVNQQNPYKTAEITEARFADRWRSFRTWHNPNESGRFTRSEQLFSTLRIFAGPAGQRTQPEMPAVLGNVNYQVSPAPAVEMERKHGKQVSITEPDHLIVHHQGFGYYAVCLNQVDFSSIHDIVKACERVEQDTWVAQEDFFEYIQKSDLLVYAERDGEIVGFNLISVMFHGQYCIYTIDEAMVKRGFQGFKIARTLVTVTLWWFMKKGQFLQETRKFCLVSTSCNPKVVNNYFKNKYLVNFFDNSFRPSSELIEVHHEYLKHYNYELVNEKYPFCLKNMFPGSNQFEKMKEIPRYAGGIKTLMPPDFDYVKRGDAWSFMVTGNIAAFRLVLVIATLAFVGVKVLNNSKLGKPEELVSLAPILALERNAGKDPDVFETQVS